MPGLRRSESPFTLGVDEEVRNENHDAELIDRVLQAVTDVRRGRGESAVWVRQYVPDCEGDHQFVIFFKPEVMAESKVHLQRVLDLVLQLASDSAVSLLAIRAIGWRYLGEHDLIASHYSVVNRISHEGRGAISHEAEVALNEKFEGELQQGAEVIGAHQLLENYPQMSSLALLRSNDDGVSKRLAMGTYALASTIADKHYIVLNAFHPYQLDTFVKEPNVLLVFEARSKMPWSTLRQRFAGSTDPSQASEGSIRRELLRHQSELGMQEVSRASNGVHVSAGPLEGMVEVRRFFGNPIADNALAFVETCFGKDLVYSGLSAEAVERFSANPDLAIGNRLVSAFDVTEEMNAGDAVQLLARASYPRND